MKTLTTFLCAVLFFIGTGMAAAQSNLTDTVDCHLSGFDHIKIQGPLKVYISQGDVESVKLVASPEAIGRTVSSVDGRTLKVRNKYESWSWGPEKWFRKKDQWQTPIEKVTVFITIRDMNSISVSGSGDVIFTDSIVTNSLAIGLRGSAGLSGNVNTKELTAGISGSGKIKLAGTATDATIRLSGSANFSAAQLVTENATVHISGSGHASVNASDQVNATLHGSAGLRYTGTAKINSTKSGSASINRF
jgi:hypothetical protein